MSLLHSLHDTLDLSFDLVSFGYLGNRSDPVDMAIEDYSCVFSCFDVDHLELGSDATCELVVSEFDKTCGSVGKFEDFEGLVSKSVVLVTLEVHAHGSSD